MRPPFLRLPHDVLEHIALHLALLDPRGPPADLVPLLATCSHIYRLLSFRTNNHLYARIFRATFDHRAPARRLHDHAAYAPAHALQLRAYSRALSNLRKGDVYSPSLLQDFYCAFSLFLEDDGRNIHHLLWARLPDFLERYILERLWDGREESHGWPLENGENAFALWLYWLSLTQHMLGNMSPERRDQLLFLIRPFAIYNFRYPPFLAPDNHVHFPLRGHPSQYHDHSAVTPHGFYPLYRDPIHLQHSFHHYGSPITIAEPPIGLAAKLLYIALNEQQPFAVPTFLPVDRTHPSAEYDGPTQADYHEFAARWAVSLPETDRALPHLLPSTEDADDRPPSSAPAPATQSARHDNDWERWRKCSNPWELRPSLPVYSYGSLAGMWGGLYLVPDLGNYHIAMGSNVFTPELETPHMTVSTTPMFFKLREHHSVSPAVPLPHWQLGDDPFDEGIMNAYYPRGFPNAYFVSPGDGKVRIRSPSGADEHVYETYEQGKQYGHDELSCRMCAARMADEHTRQMRDVEDEPGADDVHRVAAQDDDVERTRRAIQATLPPGLDLEQLIERERERRSDDDDDDGDATTIRTRTSSDASHCDSDSVSTGGTTDISYPCSGIQDTIITGETLQRHALAWGDFRIYGRVRAWDGLVVFVRACVWAGDDPPPHNTFVFRGYLVGRANLVGAWRNITDSVHTIPVEGPFVVSRVPPTPSPSPSPVAAAGVGQE